MCNKLNYFFIRDQNFERFYLLSKNYKWLHDMPKRQLFQTAVAVSLAQKPNRTLKIPNIYKIHPKIILCSINVVAGDSIMKHNDGLDSLTRFLKLGETYKSN